MLKKYFSLSSGLTKSSAAALCAVMCACTFAASRYVPVFADKEYEEVEVSLSIPPNIVFLGDSIAAGYGLEGYSPDDKSQCASYANILSDVFKSKVPEDIEFSSQNFAKDGLTSGGLLKKLDNGELDEALENADAVVVSIGGNDMLHTFLGVAGKDGFKASVERLISLGSDLDEDLKGFEENMPQIKSELLDKMKKKDAQLFIQTLYNPFDGNRIHTLDRMGDEKIGRLNEIITQCSDNGESYTVADVAKEFDGKAKELTNIEDVDIHPNSEGHKTIAKTLEPLIESKTYKVTKLVEKKQPDKSEVKENKKKSAVLPIAASAVVLGGIGTAMFHRSKKRKEDM